MQPYMPQFSMLIDKSDQLEWKGKTHSSTKQYLFWRIKEQDWEMVHRNNVPYH